MNIMTNLIVILSLSTESDLFVTKGLRDLVGLCAALCFGVAQGRIFA